jgi:hypothetical protein
MRWDLSPSHLSVTRDLHSGLHFHLFVMFASGCVSKTNNINSPSTELQFINLCSTTCFDPLGSSSGVVIYTLSLLNCEAYIHIYILLVRRNSSRGRGVIPSFAELGEQSYQLTSAWVLPFWNVASWSVVRCIVRCLVSVVNVFRSGSSFGRHHSKRTSSRAPQLLLPFRAAKVTRQKLYIRLKWLFTMCTFSF